MAQAPAAAQPNAAQAVHAPPQPAPQPQWDQAYPQQGHPQQGHPQQGGPAQQGYAQPGTQQPQQQPAPQQASQQHAPQPGYAPQAYAQPAQPPAWNAGAGYAPASHEPAQHAPSVMANHSRLPYAETAPPMLDVAARAPAVQAAQPPPPAHGLGPAGTMASALLDAPDAPRVLVAFLVSYDTNALGQFWPLHRGSNLLGRAGAATSSSVELPHATVSSRHATLHAALTTNTSPPAQGGGHAALQQYGATVAAAPLVRLFVSDHGSTNGTYVNDVALAPDQQRELQDGDRLRLGLFNLIVKII